MRDRLVEWLYERWSRLGRPTRHGGKAGDLMGARVQRVRRCVVRVVDAVEHARAVGHLGGKGRVRGNRGGT